MRYELQQAGRRQTYGHVVASKEISIPCRRKQSTDRLVCSNKIYYLCIVSNSNVRQNIIETASELFYKNGYNLTGINEIIKASGIAKATLYNHFKSKEDLLISYLVEKDRQLLTNISAFCDRKPKGNKRLIAVLEFLIPFFNQENFNGCWCVRSIAEVPRANKRVRSIIKSNKEKFRAFLVQLVKENKSSLSSKNQKEIANQLYLLYEGAVTESHIHDADWPIASSIRLLKDILKKK